MKLVNILLFCGVLGVVLAGKYDDYDYDDCSRCNKFDFGEASYFNGFFTGDFQAKSLDVLGRLAAGGDCEILSGASINCEDDFSCKKSYKNDYDDALVCGGSLTFKDGRPCGNVVYGDKDSHIGKSVKETVKAKGCKLEKDDERIDFYGEGDDLEKLQDKLWDLKATGWSKFKGNNMNFYFSGNKDLEVIEVDGKDLLKARSISISGRLKKSAIIVFNVDGDECGFKNVELNKFAGFERSIIWNFAECEKLIIRGVAVRGSAIAMKASVDNPVGDIYGQLFAKNFYSAAKGKGTLQFFNFPFDCECDKKKKDDDY